MESFEGEGRAGTVAGAPLAVGKWSRSMPARSWASMRTDASTLNPLAPCHVSMLAGVDLVQESMAAEVAKDASLQDGLELACVIGRRLGGLVKAQR